MNPMNTVFDAKRLIGRKYQDATIQADIKHWPFTVKPGVGDKPMIEGMFPVLFTLRSLCTCCSSHHGGAVGVNFWNLFLSISLLICCAVECT